MVVDPVTPSQTRTPRYLLAAAGICLYLLLMALAGKAGWQHVGFAALVWACLATRPAPRRFVDQWWPMILWWFAYDGMRLLEPWLLPRVEVQAPYRWENALFLSPSGTIWPFHFADVSAAHETSHWLKAVRGFCDFVYLMHIWGVPVLMMGIWLCRNERLFRRILWSFTALHGMTAALWLIFPAAPPWWVYQNGFRPPSLEHSFPNSAAQGRTLRTLFLLSANRFAAVPSLHAAYPVLLTLVLALEDVGSGKIALAGVYTAAMWFSCVFLNQHYIVDLLLGAALVPFALLYPRERAPDAPL